MMLENNVIQYKVEGLFMKNNLVTACAAFL